MLCQPLLFIQAAQLYTYMPFKISFFIMIYPRRSDIIPYTIQ